MNQIPSNDNCSSSIENQITSMLDNIINDDTDKGHLHFRELSNTISLLQVFLLVYMSYTFFNGI